MNKIRIRYCWFKQNQERNKIVKHSSKKMMFLWIFFFFMKWPYCIGIFLNEYSLGSNPLHTKDWLLKESLRLSLAYWLILKDSNTVNQHQLPFSFTKRVIFSTKKLIYFFLILHSAFLTLTFFYIIEKCWIKDHK